MRFLIKIILLFIISITLNASGKPSGNLANHRQIGSVNEITANATIVRSKKENKLVNAFPVFNNDRITTATGGNVKIKLINNSILTIGEKSSVIISTEMNKQGHLSRIALIYGQLKAEIPGKNKPNSFSVQTASATCGVRGTVFTIASGKSTGAVVSVLRGKVAFTADTITVEAEAGSSMEAFPDDSIKKTSTIIDNTRWLLNKNRNLHKDAGNILNDMNNRVSSIDSKTSLLQINPALRTFTTYYSRIANLFKVFRPLDILRKKVEYALLKTVAKIIYPIKKKFTHIKIIRGKLKAIIDALSGDEKDRFKSLSDKLDRIFLRIEKYMILIEQAEKFYRIRMLHHMN